MTVSSERYLAEIQAAVARVGASQAEHVGRAAEFIVAALLGDGVVQVFGSGHSEALAMEIAGRAGGLVPTNRLALRDLVMHGGESPQLLRDGKLERDPTVAHRIYKLAGVRSDDVFVIASNSGINGSVVELATVVKQQGHPLIAVTSADQSRELPSRHPSGRRLLELADVVLDNCAPYGDVALHLPSGAGVCAVSSITGALLAQMVTAEVVRRLVAAGHTPPIYLSANVPGGDEHNQALESRYAGRIRRSA
ncbi:MAG: sugar isomerase domain-containing protein [Micromonosporaceae bacterium]